MTFVIVKKTLFDEHILVEDAFHPAYPAGKWIERSVSYSQRRRLAKFSTKKRALDFMCDTLHPSEYENCTIEPEECQIFGEPDT